MSLLERIKAEEAKKPKHGNHCYADGVLVCGWPEFHRKEVKNK